MALQPIQAQRSFSVTITLDTSIAAGKVYCSYDNGKEIIFVSDTFVNNTLVLKDDLYADYAAVSVTYSKDGNNGHSPGFFIGDTAAAIQCGFNNDAFVYKSYQHAMTINDTATNVVWRELLVARAKDVVPLSALWTKYSGAEIMSNDSLRRLNETFQKNMQQTELSILKQYPSNYYSFWFFRDQIVSPSQIYFKKDTAYLHDLLIYFKKVFPPKVIQSVAGVQLATLLEGLVHPADKGAIAPSFSFKDMNGHPYQLSDFKGKYVLLDFWASWCPPCMKSIPFIKELRAKYPADKLVIIGLNYDQEVAKFRNAVKVNDMNWIHCFDKDKDVGRLFGQDLLPTFIFIDKEGEILYRRSGIGDEAEMAKVMARVE